MKTLDVCQSITRQFVICPLSTSNRELVEVWPEFIWSTYTMIKHLPDLLLHHDHSHQWGLKCWRDAHRISLFYQRDNQSNKYCLYFTLNTVNNCCWLSTYFPLLCRGTGRVVGGGRGGGCRKDRNNYKYNIIMNMTDVVALWLTRQLFSHHWTYWRNYFYFHESLMFLLAGHWGCFVESTVWTRVIYHAL